MCKERNMKYKKQVLCGLILCFCLCMTGCGKLYVMTDDEGVRSTLYHLLHNGIDVTVGVLDDI